MIRRLARIILMVTALICFVAVPVLAYTYSVSIQVHETGGHNYTYLPYIVDIDNDYLADNYFISASGLDTKILQGTTELQHMLADDKLLVVLPSLGANSISNLKYTLGEEPLDSFPIIVGHDGYITIADANIPEFGNAFQITIRGYINTTADGSKNIAFKDLAFKIWVSGEDEISASIYHSGGWTDIVVVATDVPDGLYTITVIADAVYMYLYVGTTLKDTETLSGAGVDNNGSAWYFMQNNVMPYAEYIKIYP